MGEIGDRLDQRAETDRSCNCRGCLAAPRPCARAPCRYRSTAAAGRRACRPASCSYCMKTRFQISIKRSPSASGLPGGPPQILLAMIVENFRARAARPGFAHAPEIVAAGNAQNFLFRQTADLFPEIERLVVVDIDGGKKLIGRNAEFFRHQPPGELDGAFLEVIAEREIAEHFEKSVVTRGIADIVEVVVLAAGAHAFLRRGRAHIGPLFQAGEDVLELHHAGIGEHQGRVVARHERRRRHDLVPLARKIAEEGRPDIVDAAH